VGVGNNRIGKAYTMVDTLQTAHQALGLYKSFPIFKGEAY
jgi:hypothetical protein